ncbi:MAG TPA: SDR family NAD(P)-dependent oxidoreductase [Chloroflexota bacterium]|nr:SDR family NAD(P)-dependent oxidoreductase [Chloroflexota bacterium]
MTETVVVTGAAGYIGSHLCEALLRRGDTVVGLDSFTAHYDPVRKHANVDAVRRTAGGLGVANRFRFLKGDARDVTTLDRLFSLAAEPVRKVVHLAARAGVRGAMGESRDYVSSNLIATTEVLEACRRHGLGDERGHLVMASSSTVYGSGPAGWDGPFSEDLAADEPLSVYGATKRGCELLAHAYSRLARMRVTCLRFFGVIGPRVRSDLSAFTFTDAVWHGRPITRYGDGTTARDYTYVGDIVTGILLALDRFERAAAGLVEPGGAFECVNLGNDRPVTLDEYLDALGRLLDRPVVIREGPEHPMDAKRTWADLAKARRLLGYRPTTSFEDALREVVDWYEREIAETPRTAVAGT